MKYNNPYYIIFIALIVGFFAVFTHIDSDSMGFSTSISYLIFFLYLLYVKSTSIIKSYIYALPILFIIISFSLYNAAITNIISFLTLPFIIGFYHMMHSIDNKSVWNSVLGIIETCFKIIYRTIPVHLDRYYIASTDENTRETAINIIKGVVLFIILSFILVPLLSLSNTQFSAFIDTIYSIISVEYFIKTAISLILSYIVSNMFIMWNDTISYTTPQQSPYNTTTLYTCMILLLFLYAIFIVFQLSDFRIYFTTTDFSTVEMIAKTGFWSLFIVSMINILVINTLESNKNDTSLKLIYTLFIILSTIIMLSGAVKILFYIFFYGLSYEKFYAFIAVLYCILVYATLLYYTFIKPHNTLLMLYKSLMIALWTYGIMTILPLDLIIYKTNTLLKTHPESRINLEELRSLSYDVLPFINTDKDLWAKNINRYDDYEPFYNTNIMALIINIGKKSLDRI